MRTTRYKGSCDFGIDLGCLIASDGPGRPANSCLGSPLSTSRFSDPDLAQADCLRCQSNKWLGVRCLVHPLTSHGHLLTRNFEIEADWAENARKPTCQFWYQTTANCREFLAGVRDPT